MSIHKHLPKRLSKRFQPTIGKNRIITILYMGTDKRTDRGNLNAGSSFIIAGDLTTTRHLTIAFKYNVQ